MARYGQETFLRLRGAVRTRKLIRMVPGRFTCIVAILYDFAVVLQHFASIETIKNHSNPKYLTLVARGGQHSRLKHGLGNRKWSTVWLISTEVGIVNLTTMDPSLHILCMSAYYNSCADLA